MDWSKDSLLSKARIFFSKAFLENRDDIFFGMFCSIGLELLERAAIANIHPTLLADQDDLQRNILYALNKPSGDHEPKSIITTKVITLCEKLIPNFDKDCKSICLAMAKRRNAEAHSGRMAFQEYNSDQWLGELFYVAEILSKNLDITLVDLFNKEIAEEAEITIAKIADDIKNKVLKEISSRKLVYEKDLINKPEEVEEKISVNINYIEKLSHEGYHKVSCPSCSNSALIFGNKVVKSQKLLHDNYIEILKYIIPTEFECKICGLRLESYQELKIASLPLHYSRKINYSPAEYYGFDDISDTESECEPWLDYSNE